MGVLERYDVEMIGAKPAAIDMAEDRALFREAMARIGLETPRSFLANATEIKDTDRKLHESERARLRAELEGDELDAALDALENTWNLGESDRKQRYMSHAMAQAARALDEIGLPAIIRPSFTWAAPAAASPTTARSSSTSSSAASTPRPPPKC
jgi:carbamoyl-phosphate synthase large subunit